MTVDTELVDDSQSTSMDASIDALRVLVQSNPQEALRIARDLLAEPQAASHLTALWSIVGRSLYELGDTKRAATAMRKALDAGSSVESAELVGVRISAAAIFADLGELAAALLELATAEKDSTGIVVARIRSQRAYLLASAGRLLEAREQADLAEVAAGRTSQSLDHLRMLIIRSYIALQIGDLNAAESDLVRAARIARRLDQNVTSALIVGNLGVVHARAGRTSSAMQHFDRALAMYVSAGRPLRTMAILETDRAEMLLRAGLFDDAVPAARRAVTHASESGNVVTRGDAELLLARTYLAAGMLEAARRTASDAAVLLRGGRRTEIALQARAIGIQAALGSITSERSAVSLFGRSIRLGSRLERAGWTEFSDDLRSARLRAAGRLGILHAVSDDMVALRRSIRSRRPPEALRAWHAETLAHSSAGNHRAAMQAASRGMKALERFRRSTDDLQIRAGLSAIGNDLATLALHLAIESNSPSTTFGWADRTRARAYGVVEASHYTERRLGVVAARLGSRSLVEFVIDGDDVWAVVVRRGRSRLVSVGSLVEISKSTDRVTAWLDRSVQPGSATARPGSAASALRSLASLLVAPLGLPPSGEVIVVPIGALHAAPWSALMGADRSVAVCLSARAWFSADIRLAAVESVAAITGPEVSGGAVERAAIRRLAPAAPVRSGGRATAAAVRRLLETHDLVHIAAHGVFQPDRPLQSTLRLADGEMPIFGLNEIEVVSKLVILSSCEAGVHRVNPGGEVLGLVGILLSRGADTVIAPVHTVPDSACAQFVAEFYEIWSNGLTAAEALALVRGSWMQRPSLAQWATAAAFTCFGSGRATNAVAAAL